MATKAPAPVDAPVTRIITGPPTSGPSSVPPGPGTTYQNPTVPKPIGPPETDPPPVTPGPGTGQSTSTTATAAVPVSETPAPETTTSTSNNVTVSTPVYVQVLADGTVVTENTRSLNFIGGGVSITGSGSSANITITGGGNGSPGGSNTQLQYNSSGAFGGSPNLTYNNASQVLYLGGILSATGNIIGNYILGNGSQLTGLPSNYTNANVAAYLPTYTGNLASMTGNVTTTANVTGGNLLTSGLISSTGNISGSNILGSANVIGGNLTTVGQVSATGNITGAYFVGNGSLLTGIAAGGYGNSNVVTLLAGFGSNTISTTGNVTAGNFIGGGAGTPTVSSATNLDLSAAAAVRVIGGGTLRLPSLTTAQIANITAANGDMVYNSSLNKFQGYENGAWANII